MSEYKERAIGIGKPTALVGVISEPRELDAERPAVIIFNSGVMHHIGTCRLSVKLARSIAAAGNLALRFDFSGIGDSEPRRGTHSFEESAPMEAAEVMDYLQRKRGVSRFILYGLCSGADASYETALKDSRVIGFAQIDPYCYRTPRYYFHYYASRLLVLERWLSTARRLREKLLGKQAISSSPAAEAGIEDEYYEMPSYIREFPPRQQIESGLKALVDRGVKNYVLVTGNEPDYNYENQYRDSFSAVGFRDLLEVDYLQEANHIITHPEHQRWVVERITRWVQQLA